MIKVLVVDDHPLFREGIATLLQSTEDAELIGEAANGEEAIDLALMLRPDVILMDLNLPKKNGIEATRLITNQFPAIGVLILTMFDDDDSVFAALKAGARGYLLKGANRTETIRAIQAVANGESIFSPAIAGRLLQFFKGFQPATPLIFPQLTERERDILELIVEGKDNAEISRILGITLKTVRNHISNIYSKLHVADRTEAITQAKNEGMGRKEY
ncbi:LuxR family two component transcriptional regulator [Bacillus oleivorans]|uniref:LuxR family two component transcriptional regulator n=1 Tax=Bacillus oleivorans TaxID=1448271 RepID=A0A285CYM8_9BACI|nr:response regulator transcription factor [Bacillus oleivorans]SNX72650.1 LuxR family two component transcriptional regulator [Bacillus oleivorans]